MDPNTFPTKGNLILAKNSLALSRQGFELMDKKRNILIREMMELIDQAKDIQTPVSYTHLDVYKRQGYYHDNDHSNRNSNRTDSQHHLTCELLFPW